MPDHIHWLFQLQPHNSLASIVRRVKGTSAYRVNKERGEAGSLWQPGFHERALKADESIVDAGNYIIANPVRAGLVSEIEEYSLWGLMLNEVPDEANRG